MSLIPTKADMIEIDRKRAAELDALRAEVARLRGLCPHALEGACLDWELLAARRRAEAESLRAELLSAREALRDVVLLCEEPARVGYTKREWEAAWVVSLLDDVIALAGDGDPQRRERVRVHLRALSPSPKGTPNGEGA